MPHSNSKEADILDGDQQALLRQSRQPALGQLDDAALMQLIADLTAARDNAGGPGNPGEKSPYDLLKGALNRAQGERRSRGLKPARAKKAKPDQADVASTAKAAAPRRTDAPRKPAARKKAEARKNDVRTAPRRVAKSEKKTAATVPVEPVSLGAATQPASAKAVGGGKGRKAETPEEKLARKAAEKEARRAARKAQKDAEKEAARAERRAARQAERAAAKQAEKAARQGVQKQGTGNKDTTGKVKKGKGGKKAD